MTGIFLTNDIFLLCPSLVERMHWKYIHKNRFSGNNSQRCRPVKRDILISLCMVLVCLFCGMITGWVEPATNHNFTVTYKGRNKKLPLRTSNSRQFAFLWKSHNAGYIAEVLPHSRIASEDQWPERNRKWKQRYIIQCARSGCTTLHAPRSTLTHRTPATHHGGMLAARVIRLQRTVLLAVPPHHWRAGSW